MDEFTDVKDRIRLFWSLFQLEKACLDPSLVNETNLLFLQDVLPSQLDPRHFLLFKQLVCLAKQWFEKDDHESKLDYEAIYQRFQSGLSQELREYYINEDPATKSNKEMVAEIQRALKSTKQFSEVNAHLSDDLMNLIDVAAVAEEEG